MSTGSVSRKSRGSQRFLVEIDPETTLEFMPLDLIQAVRDATDLSPGAKMVFLCMARRVPTMKKDHKYLRGEPRPHYIADDIAPAEGWCPAEQRDGSALAFSIQDPLHPEVVTIHRECVDGVWWKVARPITTAEIMAETTFCHVSVIKYQKELEAKGWVRVVVDDLRGQPVILDPKSKKRKMIRGKAHRRVLFTPGRPIDLTKKFPTRGILSLIRSRGTTSMDHIQFAAAMMCVLHGDHAFQNEATLAKEVGRTRRTLMRHLTPMISAGLLERVARGNQTCWSWKFNRSDQPRDRGPKKRGGQRSIYG